MVKPVSEVFREQFWKELQTNHRAAQERAVKITAAIAAQDAVVIEWTSKAIQQERLKHGERKTKG